MKIAFAAVAVLALASPAFAQPAADAKPVDHLAHADADHADHIMADGVGVVKSVDKKAGTVTIQHDPMPALKWPAMVMPFKAAQPSLLDGVAPGQAVTFQVMQMGDATTLTAIQRK